MRTLGFVFLSPSKLPGNLESSSSEEGPLGCIVIKKVQFSSPNLVMGFVNHQIW